MIEIPPLVEEVARRLDNEGYRYSEAYPPGRWKKEGWPTDPGFYGLVDGVMKILRIIDGKDRPQVQTS